jgi:hypothetical protein
MPISRLQKYELYLRVRRRRSFKKIENIGKGKKRRRMS